MSAIALEEVFEQNRVNLTIVNDMSENEKVSVVFNYSDGQLAIDFPEDYPEQAPIFSPCFEKLDDHVMSLILETSWERFKNDTFRLDRLMDEFEFSLLPELRQEQIASEAIRSAKEQAASIPEHNTPSYKNTKIISEPKASNRTERKTKISKNPKLKTAEDVIRRIQWDERMDSCEFIVGYVDRFVGLQEKAFDEFSFKNFVDVHFEKQEFGVPQHRIQYFKWKGNIVWDKTVRMDYIFGSGNSTRTIFDDGFEFE